MGGLYFTNLTREVEIGANCYRLELGGKTIVLDSGMHPTREGDDALPRFEMMETNQADAVIVSHAHHDHIGSLPILLRKQLRAKVFMSEATSLLSETMLHNSVNVMQREYDAGHPPPLFTHREVDLGARRWQGLPLHTRFSTGGERMSPVDESEVSIEFYDAGHILGSVGTMIRGDGRTVLYAGDVNFDDQTIMRSAQLPESPIDVLIMECTRGDRAQTEGWTRANEEQRLIRMICEVFARGGAVLIPVFALGKTQELLAILHAARQARQLRLDMPIYIGGLGAKLTELYDRLANRTPRHLSSLRLMEAVAPYVLAGATAQETPIKPGRVYSISSGMMSEHTLSNRMAPRFLTNEKHAIFFVGYADPNSAAGHLLAAGQGGKVTINPESGEQTVRCQIERFMFSGHASRESIRDYILRVRPKTLVLVHGDQQAIHWFRSTIASDLPETKIVVPTVGERFEL